MDTTDQIKNIDALAVVEKAFMDVCLKFTQAGISPMASAAVMAKLALMLYKSSLTEEQYYAMVDAISESRDAVMSFDDYSTISTTKLN